MDYRNTWSFWMHPLLTALATNPAYYYYYTAKADLFNQSIMVRRGNQRVSKKTHSSIPAQPSPAVAALPFGTLGGTGGNPNEILRQHGIAACPQCQTLFNGTNCRPVQEACGHIKCRTCFISNDDRCPQCREAERPRRNSSIALVSTSRRAPDLPESRVEDLDLMPPLLTVEEPLQATGLGSSGRSTMTVVPMKELPPLLSSVTADAQSSKASLKRKQSKDFNSVAPIPAKVQKSSIGGRSAPKVTKEPDPRERPKSSRRTSTNSSKSDQKGSGSPKPSRFFRQVSQEGENSSSNNIDISGESTAGKKRNSRTEAKKSSTIIPASQHNIPVTIATHLLGQSHHKEKSARLSTLRSSAGSSTGASTSSRRTQSPSSQSKRKDSSPQSPNVTKPRLSYSRHETKDSKAPSFKMTISPTTFKPSKHSSSSSSVVTSSPLLSPSKVTVRGDGVTSPLSRALISSKSDGILPGSSSSEGSNSNSLETCDPLYIKDDWSDSKGDKTRKPETKKKKKRNPVVIHDHITTLSGDPPLYQCNVCMKKFKTKAHIKYHEFCQNGEKPFKCEQCGQGFIAKSHYEYHLRTHTGERPYVCPKCGKGFNQRGKVTRHMRSHTGEKPFICQQCGRGFANAQALRSHFLIHTGERPFACQYCNKRFTGMTNLKKHVITHTGERPFSCTHCGKSFGLKWTLDLHLRTHSTERPFACDQCTRAFSNSKDLRRHLVIHSGERPFKCWICGTAFRRKDNLDRHIKNTHNQPKEVAKQLANEAAAEYMALTKQNQVNSLPKGSTSKRTIGHLFAPSSLSKGPATENSPGTSRGVGMKLDKKTAKKTLPDNMDVIITADLSPPSSPNQAGTDVCDVYVLPNGQSDMLQENLLQDLNCVEPKTEADAHAIELNEFDGLAELRTVPASEYHKIEAIKMLEQAKTSSDASDSDSVKLQPKEPEQTVVSVEKDVKPILEGSELFSSAPESRPSGQTFTPGLTVTVVYENDGTTHFIQQPSSYPAGENPLNFPEDQTNLLTIAKDTLFGFGPSDSTHTTPALENQSQDPSSSPAKRWDILSKKSETILSGNLSKFLEYDVPKNFQLFNESSANSDGDTTLQMNEGRSCDLPIILSSSVTTNDNDQSLDTLSSSCETQQHERNQTKEANGQNVANSIEQSKSCSSKNLNADEVSSQEVTDMANEGFQEERETMSPSSSVVKTDEAVEGFCEQLSEEKDVKLLSMDRSKENCDSKCQETNENELFFSDVKKEKEKQMGELTDSLNRVESCQTEVSEPVMRKSLSDKEKELNESSVQDGLDSYHNDPMLQDRITDDDDKFQHNMDDRVQPMELSQDHEEKESVDSILPEGLEEHYECSDAIFQDNIVQASHKLEDSNSQTIRHLQDIVDKECPASILQDEGSICGSVDPVSEDENDDFNDDNYSESPKHELQKPKLRESIDTECPELILAPESESENTKNSETNEPLPPNEFSELNLLQNSYVQNSRMQSHRDSDMESVSSTELEQDDQESVTKCLAVFESENCPNSIMEDDEDDEIAAKFSQGKSKELPSKNNLSDKDYLDHDGKTDGSLMEASPGPEITDTIQEYSNSLTPVLAKSGSPATGVHDGCGKAMSPPTSNDKPFNSELSNNEGELTSVHEHYEKSTEDSFIRRETGVTENVCKKNISLNYANVDADDVEPISDTELEDLDDSQSDGNTKSNFAPSITSKVADNCSGGKLFDLVLLRTQRQELSTRAVTVNTNYDSSIEKNMTPFSSKGFERLESGDASRANLKKRTEDQDEPDSYKSIGEVKIGIDDYDSNHEEGEIFSPKPSEDESMHDNDESMQDNDESMQDNDESMQDNDEPMQVNDGSTPVNDGSTPVNDGSTPVNDGSTPVNDGSTPVNDGSTPVNDGSSPVSDGSIPISDGSIPISDGSIPVNDGSIPVNDGSIPVNDGSIPVKDGSMPVNDGSIPVNDGSIPVNDGSIPVNDGSTPVNDGSIPVNDGSIPVNDGSIPVNDGSIPVNDGSIPVNDGSIPVNDRSTPVNDGSIPVNDGSTPINDGSIPVNDGSIPVNDESTQDNDGSITVPDVSETKSKTGLNSDSGTEEETARCEEEKASSIIPENAEAGPSRKTESHEEDIEKEANAEDGLDDGESNVVETAEKSTQCIQTEDFSDFNGDESNDDFHIAEANRCVPSNQHDDATANSEQIGNSSSVVQVSFQSSETTSECSKVTEEVASTILDDLNSDRLIRNHATPKDVEMSPVKLDGDEQHINIEMESCEKSPERKELPNNYSEDYVTENGDESLREDEEAPNDGIYGDQNQDSSKHSLPSTDISDTEPVPSPCHSHSSDTSNDVNEASYLSIGDSGTSHSTLPFQARLVYTNANLMSNGVPQSSSSQPLNYSQPSIAVSSAYSQSALTTSTSIGPDNVVNNYRFLYAPEVPTTSTVSSYPSSQSSFRFVYDNGEHVPATEPSDSNMRIVYACAAATAEAPDGDSSGPQKVKLLYAEALGVGTPDDSGQVQLVYTSTAPNQNLIRSPNQNVQIYSPTLITTDSNTNADNIQMLFAQQSELEQRSATPLPVEVLYNGNGTVMAQTIGQPQDLSWIKRDLNNQSFLPHLTPEQQSSNQQQQHDKHPLEYTSNVRVGSNPASTRELANHHNYATNPYLILDNSKRVRLPSPYETESDGLRTLARAAATRMFSIQAEADATTRAAAAIAAVGREAQMKRQLDIIERNRNLPGPALLGRKGENVPHRGPRKRYLSQLTNSRK